MLLRLREVLTWAAGGATLTTGLLIGCSRNQKDPQFTPAADVRAPAPNPAASVAPPGRPVSSSGSFHVSERVRTGCKLPGEPEASPQFDFDDAGLRDRGKHILDGIGDCMSTGALNAASLMIVGHTDPRGPEAYNESLGMRRAEAARDYLMSKGVPSARITVQSRGELDATGTDENGWQLYRRIDIDQGGPSGAGSGTPSGAASSTPPAER